MQISPDCDKHPQRPLTLAELKAYYVAYSDLRSKHIASLGDSQPTTAQCITLFREDSKFFTTILASLLVIIEGLSKNTKSQLGTPLAKTEQSNPENN